MARMIGDGTNDVAYADAGADDDNWRSKFAVQWQVQGPGGIQKKSDDGSYGARGKA